jgi:hypothetical protein
VNKRTWLYVQPGEEIGNCIGCHEDRSLATVPQNPNPIAKTQAPTDLNTSPAGYTYINYRDHIGPIVRTKCQSCHIQTIAGVDTIPPAGGLDLSEVPDTTMENQIFPRAYVNLSGEADMGMPNVTDPGFPRRSTLVDYALGVGSASAQGPHPSANPLSPGEQRLFTFWVMLGAQYR